MKTLRTTQQIDETFRLKKKELVGYAFGDLAGQTLINFVSTFFLLFCTDYLGIAPALAGTIFLVARIWDAVNDPLMGVLTDHTKTRLGSYRPYIAIGAPLVMITFIIMFTKPDIGTSNMLIWAYITYLLFSTVTNATDIPYGALPNVTTLNPRDRALMGVFRDYGANIGGFLVSTFGTMMILHFSGVGDGETMTVGGFRTVAIIAGVFALVCYYILFFTQKERVAPPKTSAGLFKGLGKTLKNRPAVCLLLMGFCFNMAIQFKANMTSYYCIQVLGNTEAIGMLLTLVYTLPLIGLLFVPKLMTIFQRRTFLSVAGVLTILSGIVSLVGGRNIPAQVVSSGILGVALSCTFALIWSSMPDAIDAGEVAHGVRTPGVTYSMATFMIKAAAGLSSFVAGWILTGIMYDNSPNAIQSAETIDGIALWYGIYPIIWGVLMFIFSRIYNLDSKTVEKNAAILAKRRADEQAEA